MLTPPPDLGESEVTRLVRGAWSLPLQGCRYLAEGMGSHHWLGHDDSGEDRWFITADRVRSPDKAEELQACFTVVTSLAERLAFVLGPRAASDGSITVRAGLNGDLLLTVRDYLPGETGRFGEFERPEVRSLVVRALAELHALPVPDLLPRWEPEDYADIRSALARTDGSWSAAGPFAEAARTLVRGSARDLACRLENFDAACGALERSRSDVISHGEPHAANVLVSTSSGSKRHLDSTIALLDWDTVRAAPRERDLAVALPAAESDMPPFVAQYLEASRNVGDIDQGAIALFREEWALNDIDVTLRELTGPHIDTADSRAALDILGRCLGALG